MDYDTLRYIQKKIKEKRALYCDKIIIGVDNFNTYQYIIGQIRSLDDLLQDLTDLLKKQELNDDNNASGARDSF